MFGKLLKNDLKAQWHYINVLFVAAALLLAAGEIAAIFAKSPALKIMGGLAVCLVSFFIFVVIIIAVAIMYSKTMFGKAGYLTLTLPVKTSKLIWSKTVTGLVWVFFGFALFIVSALLLMYQATELMGEESIEGAETLLSMFGIPSFKNIIIYCICLAVGLAVSALVIVQSAFFGVTLSNVSPFSHLGKIGTVVFAFLTFYLVQEVSDSIANLIPLGMVIKPDSVTFTSDIINTVSELNKSEIYSISFNFIGPSIKLAAGLLLNIPITYLTKNNVNVK